MQAHTSVLRSAPALRPNTTLRPSAARPQARPLAPLRSSVVASATYKVTFRFPKGEEKTIEVPDDTLILDAAEEAGIDLPYSCHGGTCSTCCCRIMSGEVDQSEQRYLDEGEIEKGFALICSSYPQSDLVLLTHQETALQDAAMESLQPHH